MRKPKTGDRKAWSGGYARFVEGRGWVFYLKTRKPVPIERCTGVADDEVLARAHLEAFRRNPEAYNPQAVRIGKQPLFVDDALGIELLNYLAAPQEQGGKGDSAGHLADTRSALRFWRDRLVGRDLRTLSAEDVRLPPGSSGYKYKTRTMKTLLSWLRKIRAGGGLGQAEGPDERLLVLPQARGMKLHDPKKALARRQKGTRALNGYQSVRKHLTREISARRPPLAERAARSRQEARLFLLALDVLAATGWHVRELVRWIELGGIEEPMPIGRRREGAAVLFTTHKRGTEHRTAVSDRALRDARELYQCTLIFKDRKKVGWDPIAKESREFQRRPFPEAQFNRVVRRACEILDIPPFGPGHLRHAVATYAAARGNQPGEFLGHTSEELSQSTYIDPAVQIEVSAGLPREQRAARMSRRLHAPSRAVPMKVHTPR